MLTIMLVYELSDVTGDLKWATNTHVTSLTLTFKAYLTISMVLEDFFLPVHHQSTHISACLYSFLPVLMMGGRVST